MLEGFRLREWRRQERLHESKIRGFIIATGLRAMLQYDSMTMSGLEGETHTRYLLEVQTLADSLES